MKRPFAVLGLTYLCALVTALACKAEGSFYLAVACLLLFLLSLFIKPLRKQKTVPAALLAAAVAFASFCIVHTAVVKPVSVLRDHTVQITGKITDIPYEQYGRFYYKVETTQVELEQAPQHITCMLSAPSPIAADFYDQISCLVNFKEIYEPAQAHYAAKGMFISAYIQDEPVTVTPVSDKPLYYYALCTRQAITQAVSGIMPSEQAALTNALLLGDKHGLDQDRKSDFNKIGAGHLIVVSGLHMSVIASFLYMLFYKLFKKEKTAALISIAGIFLFMAVTGFTPSVMRAGIMLAVYMAAKLFNRQADSLNSLGLAALVLTVFNPLAVGDVGMLLSFSATLGILLLYPPANAWIKTKIEKLRFCKRPLYFICTTFLVSSCAVAATMPVMLFTFGTFSPYFLLSNLLLVWAAQIVLMLVLPMVLLCFCGAASFLAYPFAFVATALCSYMLYVSALLAKLPYAQIDIDKPYIWLWMSATLFMAAVAVLLHKGFKPLKTVALLSAAVLLCGIVTDAFFNRHLLTLKVLDTGDGASIVLERPASCAILSCGGSAENEAILQYLEETQKPVDLQVIAQGKRSTRYAQNIADTFDVQSVLLYDTDKNKTLKEQLPESQDNLFLFTKEKTVHLWNEAVISIQAVDGFVWIYLQTPGKSVLICPDGGSFADIPKAWRSADLCVASVLPQAYACLNSGSIVFSNTVEKSTAQAYAIAPYVEYIAATPHSGAVEILLSKS